MKYALLIYSPSTADEYGASLDQARKAAGPEHGQWVDYTRAARAAGALVAAEQFTHSETATSVHAKGEDRLSAPRVENRAAAP